MLACGKQKHEDGSLFKASLVCTAAKLSLGLWVGEIGKNQTWQPEFDLQDLYYRGHQGDVSTTEVKMAIQSTCDRTGDSQCIGIPVKPHDLYDQHPLSLWIAEPHPNH